VKVTSLLTSKVKAFGVGYAFKKAVTPRPIELVVAVNFPSAPAVEPGPTRADGPRRLLSLSICETLLFVFVPAVVRRSLIHVSYPEAQSPWMIGGSFEPQFALLITASIPSNAA
jgi:hypothetical protein